MPPLSWPHWLKKDFQVVQKNFCNPGCGQNLIGYIIDREITRNEYDLICVGWSGIDRLEYQISKDQTKYFKDFHTVNFDDVETYWYFNRGIKNLVFNDRNKDFGIIPKLLNDTQQTVFKHLYNIEYVLYQNLCYIKHINDLCQQKNIKIFNLCHQNTFQPSWLSSNRKEIFNLMEKHFWVRPFLEQENWWFYKNSENDFGGIKEFINDHCPTYVQDDATHPTPQGFEFLYDNQLGEKILNYVNS